MPGMGTASLPGSGLPVKMPAASGKPHPPCHAALCVLVALSLCLLAACRRDAAPPVAGTTTRPAQAVRLLAARLRRDDLAGYARHAVPPALHARLVAAWREDRSRWPLTELPLHARLPGFITTLAAPGAEALLGTYNRQFAGATGNCARPRPRSACSRCSTCSARAITAPRSATTTSS